MTYETRRYETADGLATVTLDRPAVHNAMNETRRRELIAGFHALATDDAVRGWVLGGRLELALASDIPIAGAEEAVVEGPELPLAAGLRLEHVLSALLRTTEDRLEGARAFADKRPPRWERR